MAVSRVYKRLEDDAFKNTTILSVYDIPDEHNIDIAKRIPMFNTITELSRKKSELEGSMEFVRDVVTVNENIVFEWISWIERTCIHVYHSRLEIRLQLYWIKFEKYSEISETSSNENQMKS